jgi:DNA-binding GntR family transcriptional regulator
MHCAAGDPSIARWSTDSTAVSRVAVHHPGFLQQHRLLIEARRDRDHASAERIPEPHIRRTRVELVKHPELFAHWSQSIVWRAFRQ